MLLLLLPLPFFDWTLCPALRPLFFEPVDAATDASDGASSLMVLLLQELKASARMGVDVIPTSLSVCWCCCCC